MRHIRPAPTFRAMALPKISSGLSAADDLGMGSGLGDMLGQQAAGETEELRKKRMQQMQDRTMMGPAGSPATLSLFGGLPGGGRY